MLGEARKPSEFTSPPTEAKRRPRTRGLVSANLAILGWAAIILFGHLHLTRGLQLAPLEQAGIQVIAVPLLACAGLTCAASWRTRAAAYIDALPIAAVLTFAGLTLAIYLALLPRLGHGTPGGW